MTRIVDDDEAEIEAEIQKELDAISAENLEIEDLEEDLNSFDDKYEDGTALPESLEEYLKFVQTRTEGIEQEINDCDALLHERPLDGIKNEDEILAQKIKEALGEDCHDNPLDIRNKVLSEIEEAEEKEQQEKQHRASCTNNMALDIIRPDISDQVRLLEETAEKQLQKLEEKQSKKNQERIEMYERMKREENERLEKERNLRKQRQEQLDAAQKLLNENQKMLQEKIKNEKEQDEEKLYLLQQKFQKEIKKLEEESEKEKKALEEIQYQEAEYQRVKQTEAAVRIQKTYRGHKVYVKLKDILEQRRKERIQKYEDELEKRYQEEMKRREEEDRNRVEEERIRKEKQWKKEMDEKKRREDEREDEKKREEEQKKKTREMEDRKRREEDERKRKEEEKKRTEEDQRLKEMEDEKRKEEERKKEEEKQQLEELKKKKEEEERMKKEKEQKREEEERKKEEMRKKEMERKQKEEQERNIAKEKQAQAKRNEFDEIERKRKEMEDKWRLENDKKQQDEQKRKEEMINKEKQIIIDDEKRKCEETQKDEIQPCSKYLVNLEERRTKWLKEHTPWSSTTYEERDQPVAKTKARLRPRRPFSASKSLPSLTKEQLLQSSPPGTSLHKVVRVRLSSCPACNMHGLDCCTNIKTLTLTDCGLMAVEGLEGCKELQELRLQGNKIEYINIRDMLQLDELLLSNNNLTSVQGLVNCTRLKDLDLTNNKLTRIGDLSTCPNLQKLSLDNNQLITTKGLSNLSRLQSLGCANNHLPNVKEIDRCQLLQVLNLTGNNLQKPPLLTNHVLLRELWLDDNSISTLEPLAIVWLPSLRLLSVSQNSVSTIDSLDGLVMLQSLDISHNLISDIDSLIPGLSGCKQLQTLKITGNPVNEEPQCRKTITDSLSSIIQLDDEVFQPQLLSSATNFIETCLRQLQEYNNMISTHTNLLDSINEDTTDPNQVIHRLNIKNQQFDELYQQAVAHLLEHEQFGVDGEEKSKHSALVKEDGDTLIDNKDKQADVAKCQDTVNIKLAVVEQQIKKPCITEDVSSHRGTRRMTDKKIRNNAAVKIQAIWRGWHIRHLIDIQTKRWLAAVTIQAAWRGHSVRSRNKQRSRVSRARKALWDVRYDAAATTIQACYRGYRVRRRLTQALQSLKYDNSDEDEFNYDEEVDLSAFDFDSGALDDGWTPTDTPQLPSRGPVLPNTGQTMVPRKSKPVDSYQPRQAWQSADSPMELHPTTNQRRVPGRNLKQSPEQDLMSVTSGTQSRMTHQAEEMSNEWGLKNASTAELMWKRANRMKYNPARKRKLLDPGKRLTLFKKLDEANKLREVKPPPKRQPRLDYFAEREANMLPSGSNTPTSERQVKAQMTYSWVHSQGVVHEDQQDNYMGFTQDYTTQTKNKKPSSRKIPSQSKSSVSLPQLDAVQLTGRYVPLVSSPALIREQMSKDSTPRRNSSVSEARSTAVSGSSGHSNEKSNSAGARMTNERRERR